MIIRDSRRNPRQNVQPGEQHAIFAKIWDTVSKHAGGGEFEYRGRPALKVIEGSGEL